jgi:hypothetical protein
MSALRDEFAARFGEANAVAVEEAAAFHAEPPGTPGSDAFRWALLVCAYNQCIDYYAEIHGITADVEEVRTWVRDHADLASWDGQSPAREVIVATGLGWCALAGGHR